MLPSRFARMTLLFHVSCWGSGRELGKSVHGVRRQINGRPLECQSV